ncbi:hypothetical protein TKK_0012938 [Trichogramma kaykai]
MQRQGVDFNETFSPVLRYDSFRVLLVYIIQEDPEILTLDVCSTFPYGELEEQIYMVVPEGIMPKDVGDNNTKDVMCLLRKSLYGLKQAPRCRNARFKKLLYKNNLHANKCIFTKSVKGEKIILALFVDDGLLACSSTDTINSILQELNKKSYV